MAASRAAMSRLKCQHARLAGRPHSRGGTHYIGGPVFRVPQSRPHPAGVGHPARQARIPASEAVSAGIGQLVCVE